MSEDLTDSNIALLQIAQELADRAEFVKITMEEAIKLLDPSTSPEVASAIEVYEEIYSVVTAQHHLITSLMEHHMDTVDTVVTAMDRIEALIRQ